MQCFDTALFDELTARARRALRLRAHHNVHGDLADPVQRLFIAIEPGSYVRPHRHPPSQPWEFFMVLRGRLLLVLFDDDGRVSRREEVAADGPLRAVEIPAGSWHSVVALESGALFLELKQGPYMALSDDGFAPWAPQEGEAAAAAFQQWLLQAQPGDLPPSL